jgi:GNAT superfamily N-acetyltransferase
MESLEADERLAEAHQQLVTQGVIEPLAADDREVRRWLSCELASLIEGHFHRIVDIAACGAAARQEWEARVTESAHGLRDPRFCEFRRVYWLLLDGERVGTVGIDSIRLGRSELGISSLYVRPDRRARGIAARALEAIYHAAVSAGADGIRLDTSWCWQPAVRFYLRLGFWVRNWKHALVFVRSTQLCPYQVQMEGTRATFSVQLTESWTPLLEADNRGASLGWTELPTYASLDESWFAMRHVAPATFALHLAVRGWPLIRSAGQWEQRYHWSDTGMPEGLAFKIALFEEIARERGYDVRTPRIPGLDYDAAAAE